MYSDEELDDQVDEVGKHVDRSLLVKIVKKYPIVLEKSKLPSVMQSKVKALSLLTTEFNNVTGKVISVAQMKKLINNIKTALKKKTNLNATGNKVIKLKDWEKDFLDIIKKDKKSCI